MILEMNEKVYFVKGYKNGAIYDLINEKVFSINATACKILDRIFKRDSNFSSNELYYINKLYQLNLLNKYNIITEKRFDMNILIPKISLVWLEITQGCNLRCVHCYEGENHIPSSDLLPIEKWEEIIEQIGKMKIQNVVVIGGEPCIYKNLLRILSKLSKFRIKTTIVTNATLLSREIKDFLVDNKDLFTVKVSIYGPTAKVHEAVTKIKGSFEQLRSNVKYLVDNGVKVYAAVIAMRENQDHLEETRKFIDSMGVKYTRYDVIRNVFKGNQDLHTPTREDVIKNGKYTKPNFKITESKFYKNLFENSCWNGKLVITETGDYLPCVFARCMKLGNIRNTSLQNILDKKELRECWYFSMDKVKVCTDCEYRYACKDCRPLAMSVNGDIDNKNPRCQYNPYKGAWNE